MVNTIHKGAYARVTAPMVGQSDLPWRILCRRYGATLAYTQMFIAEKLLQDEEYRHSHLLDLETGWAAPLGRPVVAQLAGNDPDVMLAAAKIIEPFCDAVDLNLGCPQEHAKEGNYGGYLILAKRDWPRIEAIVSTLSTNLSIPVHVKLRLCNPPSLTPLLAVLLARAGASVVILHARHVASRHRRKGAAELKWVRAVKSAILEESGLEDVIVLSNGNVRTYGDCEENLRETGADGVMVGEALLGNPRLFSCDTSLDILDMMNEYLDICEEHLALVVPKVICQHLKNMVVWDTKVARHPACQAFMQEIGQCINVQDYRELLAKQNWLATINQ